METTEHVAKMEKQYGGELSSGEGTRTSGTLEMTPVRRVVLVNHLVLTLIQPVSV